MLVLVLGGGASAQPAPPMDPRQMSGIPRPDPQVRPGTVTVRCLLGGFAEPAIGVEVVLEITSADGSRTETRRAVAGPEGRAEFPGLEGFFGGVAVASAELGGERVGSRPIAISAEAGMRVMLVPGAGVAGAAAQEGGVAAPPGAGPHGAAGLPSPGVAFPVEGRDKGTVVVGTFDLAGLREQREPGVPGVEVVLEITGSGAAEPMVRRARTDASGRAVFEGLVPPAIPEGARVVARVAFPGAPEQRSEPFGLAESAMALVFPAPGSLPAAAASAPPRPELSGPRLDPTLPTGTVKIRVVDGQGRPVAGQAVEVVRSDMSGAKVTIAGETAGDGVATVAVDARPDALYFAGALYDGAPWQSAFFSLAEGAGVAVDLQVFPVTDDPKVVRSAMRWFVVGLENDVAQVIQMMEVLVTGDRAYWPRDGLRIAGVAGAKSLVVHPRAQSWLEATEKAPYATLSGPLPPGTPADLSVAYLLDHDGALGLAFSPPFALEGVEVVLRDDAKLEAAGVRAKEPRKDREGEVLYDLGARPASKPMDLTVTGLPTRPRVHVRLGIGILVAAAAAFAVGLLGTGRRRRADALGRERARLWQELRGQEAGSEAHGRLVQELDRLYRECDARGITIPEGVP